MEKIVKVTLSFVLGAIVVGVLLMRSPLLFTYQISEIKVNKVENSPSIKIEGVVLETRFRERSFSPVKVQEYGERHELDELTLRFDTDQEVQLDVPEGTTLNSYLEDDIKSNTMVGDNVILVPEHETLSYVVTKKNKLTKKRKKFLVDGAKVYQKNLKSGDFIKGVKNPVQKGKLRKKVPMNKGNLEPKVVQNEKLDRSKFEYEVNTHQTFRVLMGKLMRERSNYHNYSVVGQQGADWKVKSKE